MRWLSRPPAYKHSILICTSPLADSSLLSVLATMLTSAPSRRASFAIANPIPLEPPTTSTCLSWAGDGGWGMGMASQGKQRDGSWG